MPMPYRKHPMHWFATHSFAFVRAFPAWHARLLSIVMTLLAAAPAHADLLARIKADGRLRVAMSAATPPFNYMDGNKQIVGSDVDTARLLARDLGVALEIVNVTSADRVTALLERRADLVLSTLSITPERERQIAFSVPYAQMPTVIAAPLQHQYTSVLDIGNKTVGVLANSSNLVTLVHDAPNVTLLQYPENTKLIAGYAAGEFDIISAPQSVVDKYNQGKPVRPMVVQFTQSVFDIAVGMPNGEKRLRDWINAWVVANLRNEKLGNIYRKHHGGNLPPTILPLEASRK